MITQSDTLKVIYTAIAQVTSVIPQEYPEFKQDAEIEMALRYAIRLAKRHTDFDLVLLGRQWKIRPDVLSRIEGHGLTITENFKAIQKLIDIELTKMILEHESAG